MTKIRKAVAANLAWSLTTVWVGLIVVRALAITHGSQQAAVAMLTGPNLIGAATGAAGSLLVTVMTWILGPAFLAGAFAVRMGWSKNTRWILFGVGAISLIGLALAAPIFYLVLGGVLGLVSLIVGIAVARRLRSKSDESTSAESGRIEFGFTLSFYVFLLALLAIGGGSWIQSEVVSTAGEPRVAYFVSQDSDWTTFLDYEDRDLWLVRTSEIEDRAFCDVYETDLLPHWLTVSFGGIDDERLPDCRMLMSNESNR